MDEVLLPDYSLRYHKSEVCALTYVDWELKPPAALLISGDATGTLVVWDVITRRPITVFVLETKAQIVAIQSFDFKTLAVLSKDNRLRIFELTLASATGIVCKSYGLPKPPKENLYQIFEVPVNTLNFANFVTRKLGQGFYQLICANTEDSQCIDVYTFDISNIHSLRRIHKKVNFSNILQRILPEAEAFKSEKLGIIMRFLEGRRAIYCGFENGFVIGFVIHAELDNKLTDKPVFPEIASRGDSSSKFASIIEIVYVSTLHYPNPVLDLQDDAEGTFYSSSTENILGIHSHADDQDFLALNHSDLIFEESGSVVAKKNLGVNAVLRLKIPAFKISHIQRINEFTVLGTWAGQTLLMNNGEVVARISRSKSNVFVDESPQGNLLGGDDSKKVSKTCKISALTGLASRLTRGNLVSVASITPGQRRRIERFYQTSWYAVGYGDGTIAIHQIVPKK